ATPRSKIQRAVPIVTTPPSRKNGDGFHPWHLRAAVGAGGTGTGRGAGRRDRDLQCAALRGPARAASGCGAGDRAAALRATLRNGVAAAGPAVCVDERQPGIAANGLVRGSAACG